MGSIRNLESRRIAAYGYPTRFRADPTDDSLPWAVVSLGKPIGMSFDQREFVYFNSHIFPGNSGGPALDNDLKFLGIAARRTGAKDQQVIAADVAGNVFKATRLRPPVACGPSAAHFQLLLEEIRRRPENSNTILRVSTTVLPEGQFRCIREPEFRALLKNPDGMNTLGRDYPLKVQSVTEEKSHKNIFSRIFRRGS